MKVPLQPKAFTQEAASGTTDDRRQTGNADFVDNRDSFATQRKLVELAQNGAPARQLQSRSIQDAINNSSRTLQPLPPLQRKPGKADSDGFVASNHTGMPDQLKSGIELLSGMSMHDVKVHYNSSQPAQLNALAYAQGRDIHLGPGQEQHLPHEAWHVVQQAQGRVKPTFQAKGGARINDDQQLENEADVMGARAWGAGGTSVGAQQHVAQRKGMDGSVFQLKTEITHTGGTIDFDGGKRMVGRKMLAKLNPFFPVKGTATGANWTWMRKLNFQTSSMMVRGHLLNHDLGGFAIPENLFPITHRANMDHKNKVEYPLKAKLSELEVKYRNDQPSADADRLIYEVTVNGDVEDATFHIGAKTEKDNVPVDEVDGYDVKSKMGKKTPISPATASGASVPAAWRHGVRRQVKPGADGAGEGGDAERDKKDVTRTITQPDEKVTANEYVEFNAPDKLSREDWYAVDGVMRDFKAEFADPEEAPNIRGLGVLSTHLRDYWLRERDKMSEDDIIDSLFEQVEAEWERIKSDPQNKGGSRRARGLSVDLKSKDKGKTASEADAKGDGKVKEKVKEQVKASAKEASKAKAAAGADGDADADASDETADKSTDKLDPDDE